MREIKFRAWDKENKEMVEVELLGKRVLLCKNGEWENIEDFEVMQYTGLKDKNDKEIYEGDIVRHATDEGVYKVIFEDGGFYVINSYDFQTINEYPLEVIGNVYENLELLEAEGEMNAICPTCNGSGGIDTFEESIGEVVTITCPDCGGSGEITDVTRKALEGEE